MNVEIVVLAAGKGSRMKSKLPKVLHRLAGKALAEHVVDTVEGLGKIHLVVGHGANQVEDHFSERAVSFVTQTEQLGTGHAVAQAMPNVDPESIVLICYGDVPGVRRETYEGLIAIAEHGDVGLLTIRIKDPTGYGRIIRDERGNVVGIVEQKEATIEELSIDEVNTGLMAVKAKYLNEWLPKLSAANSKGEYYLTDIISMASNNGVKVTAMMGRDEKEVAGINNKEQLAVMERAWQLREARRLMQAGATVIDPARIDVRGTLKIGQDVFLDANILFEGLVVLGDDVQIAPGCVIRNSVIGNGVIIKPNTVIDGATIGDDVSVGPFARIRPGTVLAPDAQVGNFVEVKNATIGQASKVNHLSYIGDAEVGRKVNVGAGSITCNYDGVKKHTTHIGDEAFIGSNSTLIAPINVGDNAFVGAGSTLSKNVPAQDLTIARAEAKTITGWQSPLVKAQKAEASES
ncbi:bifunctional UDP-N-acetylglucosamine diphosphorylase/glucosamine-1-phosphate N-acetyltransferase GlmU [Salinibius halmophilus]|uniref:bifunctional UDP-N-acetylglucosamine diphosphorylase/glucosamine-1-phosphate N-acetyltransferase GlmU n=1 Tax=Salinibius halmophilus TaxID=1853216 RepID=UPI000E66B74E|nr:bifunctional UDP-N-acetylglucosamine diphosphorylase/glucosamine-1-phosphate N-acetyltransferase GlmU [Salinibius halmophilus]